MGTADLWYLSACDLAQAVRDRSLSPVEIVDAILARIDAINPVINAYCTVAAEAAREEARRAEQRAMVKEPPGPLLGVPISFKDLTTTAGIRTTFGSEIFADYVPTEDALVVQRVRDAGAIVIGKTNTAEFGCKSITDNRVFGVTCNPWNPSMVAGGSSGGAAAAVAAGLGPLAEGSDLAGSIRIPSACCGVVGFKPSTGRVPQYPAVHGWDTMQVTGPIARTVRDAALLGDVMSGPDDRDPTSIPSAGEALLMACNRSINGLRVAWTLDLGYASVDAQVAAVVSEAIATFGDLGCELHDDHPGFPDPDELFRNLTAPRRAATLGEYLPTWQNRMDPLLTQRVDLALRLSAVEYERLEHQRTQLWHTVRRFFERYDVLVMPTVALPAFPIDSPYPLTEVAGRSVTSPLAWVPFTYPFNMTGHPAISVPAGWTDDDLPVGLQIVGGRHADAMVFRMAAAFESARPWAHRRPAVSPHAATPTRSMVYASAIADKGIGHVDVRHTD